MSIQPAVDVKILLGSPQFMMQSIHRESLPNSDPSIDSINKIRESRFLQFLGLLDVDTTGSGRKDAALIASNHVAIDSPGLLTQQQSLNPHNK